MLVPGINIARYEISRLIVGGKPFSGFSHGCAEALWFAFPNTKESGAIALGLFTKYQPHQVQADVNTVLNILQEVTGKPA